MKTRSALRTGLWTAVAALLPGWAYAVYCPYNCPSETQCPNGSCSAPSGTNCSWDASSSQWICPVHSRDNVTACTGCQSQFSCGASGACENFEVTDHTYVKTGCSSGTYGNMYCTTVTDLNNGYSCCTAS